MTRDQERALHAYNVVGQIPKSEREDYEIAVNALGTNILRSGLAAAMAAIERRKERGTLLLKHLATANIPGLENVAATAIPGRVRGMDLDSYILATREMIKVATWLKRAVQATFGGGDA